MKLFIFNYLIIQLEGSIIQKTFSNYIKYVWEGERKGTKLVDREDVLEEKWIVFYYLII